MNAESSDNAPDLTAAGTFQHWTPVSLRFSDQDSMGHINNVAYAAYVEQSRVAFLDDFLRSQVGGAIDYILASVNIDYRREMHFPGTVDIGARFMRIGTKSITIAYGLFKNGENVATAGSVNVFFDFQSGKSIPIPDHFEKILETVSAKG